MTLLGHELNLRHEQAMELADQADSFKRRKIYGDTRRLYTKAMLIEYGVMVQTETQPSRAILALSASSLALCAGLATVAFEIANDEVALSEYADLTEDLQEIVDDAIFMARAGKTLSLYGLWNLESVFYGRIGDEDNGTIPEGLNDFRIVKPEYLFQGSFPSEFPNSKYINAQVGNLPFAMGLELGSLVLVYRYFAKDSYRYYIGEMPDEL